MTFENTGGKGEIARNEQFLLFPQCFLPVWRTFLPFFIKFESVVGKLWVWKNLKFVVWEGSNTLTIATGENIGLLRTAQIQRSDCTFCAVWSLALRRPIDESRLNDNKSTKCPQSWKVNLWNSLNPFPNKPWFLSVWSTSLLKTLWEKEKLLIMSNFSFSLSVFLPVWRTFYHFHRI